MAPLQTLACVIADWGPPSGPAKKTFRPYRLNVNKSGKVISMHDLPLLRSALALTGVLGKGRHLFFILLTNGKRGDNGKWCGNIVIVRVVVVVAIVIYHYFFR